MNPRLRVLLVEDSPADAELVEAILGRMWPELEAERVETEAAFRSAIVKHPDIVIADLEVPGFGAIAALEILAEVGSRIPLLVYTGAATESSIDRCVRLGAASCLLKDHWSRLAPTVNELLHRQLMASP